MLLLCASVCDFVPCMVLEPLSTRRDLVKVGIHVYMAVHVWVLHASFEQTRWQQDGEDSNSLTWNMKHSVHLLLQQQAVIYKNYIHSYVV